VEYQVLARKYRPQIFSELLGQEHVAKTLQNAIKMKRVAHAFLFAGPRGVGKTSAARILAKALNCEKGPSPDPCNQCQKCKEITGGYSIDVIEIDGASNRGVEEIRELKERVRYHPQSSRYKIFIIDEVHMLTKEAFNALLKTLEEPPPHVKFIFATTEPHKVPVTILSRCQRFDFKRIPISTILNQLKMITEKEKITISENSLYIISQESQGSMRDAESLLDQVVAFSGNEVKENDVATLLGVVDRKLVRDISKEILKRNVKKLMELIHLIYESGYESASFMKSLLEHFRNLVIAKMVDNPTDLIPLPSDEIEDLKKDVKDEQPQRLVFLFNMLINGDIQASKSDFPYWVMEATLVNMALFTPVIPIDDILAKLSSLKEELPNVSEDGKYILQKEEESAIKRSEAKEEIRDTDFSGFIDFVQAEDPKLASFISQGKWKGIDNNEAIIAFDNSFYYDRIKKQIELLTDFASRYFRKDIEIKIQKEKKKEKDVKSTQLEKKIKREAKEHPLVREALQLFDGYLVEIKEQKGKKI